MYALGLSSSLFLLYLAMKTMEMSIVDTAYTGIGVVGTVVAGILFWAIKRATRRLPLCRCWSHPSSRSRPPAIARSWLGARRQPAVQPSQDAVSCAHSFGQRIGLVGQ
ncbi:SMR family transporter [Chromobacterium haemolyticum]|uniref:SMR family transporter n=1 Tax=Chromobacterium haemolyticum TaxID=394935 RepID=UPI003B517991